MQAGIVVGLVFILARAHHNEGHGGDVIRHHIAHVFKVVFVAGDLPALCPQTLLFQFVVLAVRVACDRYE